VKLFSNRILVLLPLCLELGGCTFNLDWLQMVRARNAQRNGEFSKAASILKKVVERDPEGSRAITASRLGSRIAQIDSKDYQMAVEFYKHIVLRSDNPSERKNAQRNIAQIYFDNLFDYNQAVLEYEKLLKLSLEPGEQLHYRLNLAKSHLQLNNLDQAANELDSLLALKLAPDEAFDVRMQKANVLLATKHLADAAGVWESLLKDFPERAAKEKVGLNLVVCYEELKDFNRAIEVLEKMKTNYPNPDFLDLRIKRLQEKQINQPGANGWKR
jgi:tetratricopeptide (TPR) repeat protein